MVVLVHKNQLWVLVLVVVQVLMVQVHDGLAILVLLQVHREVVLLPVVVGEFVVLEVHVLEEVHGLEVQLPGGPSIVVVVVVQRCA